MKKYRLNADSKMIYKEILIFTMIILIGGIATTYLEF